MREGQLLAQFEAASRESDCQSAVADRAAAAQSALSTAEWNLEQARELLKAGAVPERDVRAAEQAVASARAQLAAAEARYARRQPLVRHARGGAHQRGRRTALHRDRRARGARRAAVHPRAQRRARARGAVPGASREQRVGQRVASTPTAQFEGRVARVSPTIDPATRSITVYVQVPNPTGALKGGTFARARRRAHHPQALVIPTAGIRQARTDRPFVYTIDGRDGGPAASAGRRRR